MPLTGNFYCKYSCHIYIVREENQLKIIYRIIENYKLNEPLNRHLKTFFKSHPKMGSQDRKLASAFVYNYFRIGNALRDLRLIERLTVANFLCSPASNPLLRYCLNKYSFLKDEEVELSSEKKIETVKLNYEGFRSEKIFPFTDHLGTMFNRQEFISSFLKQPKLWMRLRREFKDEVMNELKEKNIFFECDENNQLSLSLLNATSIEKTNSFLKGHFEVQDWSSQRTITYIQPKPNEYWWDACSGSGGKSIMMFDEEPTIKLVATDKRASIVKNLKDRFQKAGIKNFTTKELDLISGNTEFPSADSILADVPCSGSGTWARTPEWLTIFNENSIDQFTALQRNIVTNLTNTLKSKAVLVYITCSVFKEENENNVEWFKKNLGLLVEKSGYIEGCRKGADTMFAARLIKC
jgi:16S rRNA (cytosine967-C5)-methyltransferase